MNELIFSTENGTIRYHFGTLDEATYFNKKVSRIIIIDHIESVLIGIGLGSHLLKSFINFIKNDAEIIYLWAKYDPYCYFDEEFIENQSEIELYDIKTQGLSKLIKFYQKHGFEYLDGSIRPDMMVDMVLELN